MGDSLSNSPIKNVLVVIAAVLISTLIGFVATIEVTGSLGTTVTWIWIGIGLAVLYLLYVIANSVKDIEYQS